MATRQPRRTRRRSAPATSLPRPAAAEEGAVAAPRASGSRRSAAHHRSHHVTTDYRYVRKDLTSIAVIGTIALAFIIGMAIYIGAL
ncbi:MAG: hypothetical protein ACRDHF_03255 [Tepidiformaceae bacterium]